MLTQPQHQAPERFGPPDEVASAGQRRRKEAASGDGEEQAGVAPELVTLAQRGQQGAELRSAGQLPYMSGQRALALRVGLPIDGAEQLGWPHAGHCCVLGPTMLSGFPPDPYRVGR
jgi:hypothetical protein